MCLSLTMNKFRRRNIQSAIEYQRRLGMTVVKSFLDESMMKKSTYHSIRGCMTLR